MDQVGITVIDSCRVSSSDTLVPVLDLGLQPLANSLKKDADQSESKFSLSVSFCPTSSLLQLNETVSKEALFSQYVWVSGTSDATRTYADLFHDRLLQVAKPEKTDFILEIASNDGTFLKPFIKSGFSNILGVDPARNIAQMANQQGIPTLPEFWSSQVAQDLLTKHGPARVIYARNVLPHVSELLDTVSGIESLLQDEGVGVIEFHDAAEIQRSLHYDSIYHEHLCYFSVASLTYLLNRFNLVPFHIEQSPISGGSWVIYFGKTPRNPSSDLEQALNQEKEQKINELSSWENFADSVKNHRKETLETLSTVEGKTVVGFGSSARSQTYLNYCNIDDKQISGIIDNNPLKQNLYAPGSSIPIVDLSTGLKLKPDLIFILAWNFKDEIVSLCRSAGYDGPFLIPFPNKLYFL